MKKYFAEFTGTFGFVFIGCGAAVIAGPWIGYLGIAVAFGFALCAMMYAFTPVSGGHFNPAVTLALTVSGRFSGRTAWGTVGKFIGYIAAQVAGACAAAYVLYDIYAGKTGFVNQGTFNANIIERYTTQAAFWTESLLSFLFICVFLGSKAEKNRRGFAPVAVGLFLVAAYLLSIPVTRGALNPARSTSQALFGGDAAIAQLWLFWCARCWRGFWAACSIINALCTFLKKRLTRKRRNKNARATALYAACASFAPVSQQTSGIIRKCHMRKRAGNSFEPSGNTASDSLPGKKKDFAFKRKGLRPKVSQLF